jgi:ABC-2 type transport system ATP-binding protein
VGESVVAIRAEKLTKKFGNFTAVNSIDLEVSSGKIFGFLGPNGAGKTTTIKMLTGILKPTSGKVEILGMDMEKSELEIKRKIGVAPEEPRIYPFFRGYEFLNFIMDIFESGNSAKERMEELIDAFGIDFLDKYVSDMSHGMKQKLMLVSVLMREPEVLFLDEPTVGLDAKSAKILKLYLRKLAQKGKTIFMTTHVLEIAEKMCEEIAIIDRGKIIARGTIEELRKMAGVEGTLEDLFLKLTGQEEEVKKIVEGLE